MLAPYESMSEEAERRAGRVRTDRASCVGVCEWREVSGGECCRQTSQL